MRSCGGGEKIVHLHDNVVGVLSASVIGESPVICSSQPPGVGAHRAVCEVKDGCGAPSYRGESYVVHSSSFTATRCRHTHRAMCEVKSPSRIIVKDHQLWEQIQTVTCIVAFMV